jgi:hypothetical protein
MTVPTVKADVIDADAHVVETERVWDYLEASEQRYRPTLTRLLGSKPSKASAKR